MNQPAAKKYAQVKESDHLPKGEQLQTRQMKPSR